MARHGRSRAGRWPVQLRYDCALTGEEYVSQQAWRNASLPYCPLHPGGGCGFARHGSYERLSPPGTRIARWYCPKGRCTFSLLPDCLCAYLPGTLAEMESVVRTVEQSSSLAQACEELRLDIELPGALRWVRRRVQAVHTALNTLKGLQPSHFEGCEPTLTAFTERLGVAPLLPALRKIAAPYLSQLPTPLGSRRPPPGGGGSKTLSQQSTGPDPPVALA